VTQARGRAVEAKRVRSFRVLHPNDRVNEVVLELTTVDGVQHFLLPTSSLVTLSKLADKANPSLQ